MAQRIAEEMQFKEGLEVRAESIDSCRCLHVKIEFVALCSSASSAVKTLRNESHQDGMKRMVNNA